MLTKISASHRLMQDAPRPSSHSLNEPGIEMPGSSSS